MKALKIISLILTVFVLIMPIAGFFVDNYLSQIGNFIWDTVHLLLLMADLVISIIFYNRQRKKLQENHDNQHN